jgi:hypothetical protein
MHLINHVRGQIGADFIEPRETFGPAFGAAFGPAFIVAFHNQGKALLSGDLTTSFDLRLVAPPQHLYAIKPLKKCGKNSPVPRPVLPPQYFCGTSAVLLRYRNNTVGISKFNGFK